MEKGLGAILSKKLSLNSKFTVLIEARDPVMCKHVIKRKDLGTILLVSNAEVMINKDSQGHSYSVERWNS